MVDGLRTFAGSPWEPGDLNTMVAGASLYELDVDYVGRRRSGQMTARQREVRLKRALDLDKPPRGGGRDLP